MHLYVILTLHIRYMYNYLDWLIYLLIFNLPRQAKERGKAIYSTHYKYITIRERPASHSIK